MCFPNVTGGAKVNPEDYKLKNKTEPTNNKTLETTTEVGNISKEDNPPKIEGGKKEDIKTPKDNVNISVPSQQNQQINSTNPVGNEVSGIGDKAANRSNINTVGGTSTTGSTKSKDSNSVVILSEKDKQYKNQAVQATDRKTKTEVRAAFDDLGKNVNVLDKFKDFAEISDIQTILNKIENGTSTKEDLMKLKGLLDGKQDLLAKIKASGASERLVNKLEKTLAEMEATNNAMIQNLEKQEECKQQISQGFDKMDVAVEQLRAKLNDPKIDPKTRRMIESMLNLYENAKSPVEKMLIGQFLNNMTNLMSENPPDIRKIKAEVNKFCGRDPKNHGRYSDESVMGQYLKAKRDRGPNREENMFKAIESYVNPESREAFKTMLDSGAGLTGLSVRTQGDMSGLSEENLEELPEEEGEEDVIDPAADDLNNTVDEIENDPDAQQAFIQSLNYLRPSLQDFNKDFNEGMTIVEKNVIELGNLQKDFGLMSNKLSLLGDNLSKDINSSKEELTQDVDSVIRESTNSFIKKAEELEENLDLEIRGVPEITQLLQKLRTIITDLDRDLNIGYKKSNEKKMGELREFNKELREKLEHLREQKEEQQLKTNEKLNDEKVTNKFLDKKFMDKLNKLSEAIVNIDIVSNFRNKVA